MRSSLLLTTAATATALVAAHGTAPRITPTASAPGANFSPPVPMSDVLQGRYSVTAQPAVCTENVAPYQTSFWVQSNQMNVEDDGGWWGPNDPVEWTFSTNTSNIIFADPFYPGATDDNGNPLNPKLTARKHPNSFTVSMSGLDQGQNLFWQVFSDNGTTPGQKYWNSTGNDQPIAWEQLTFQMNIQGSAPCPHPVGNTSCAEDTIQNTADQWAAYGVDDWLSSWIQNNSASFSPDKPMMRVFQEQFGIGSGSLCSITESCKLIDVCKDLPDNGSDPDSAQIYLVLIALENLSDMFNSVYETLQIGELETLTQIATIALDYHNINNITTPSSQTPLGLAAGIMGVFSGILGFIPGISEIKAGISVANSIVGLVSGELATGTSIAPDPQYAQDAAQISQYLGQYVGALTTSVEDAYTGVFTNGTNITTILQGGALVNRTILNIDCNDCLPKQQGWLEQYLGLKMINNMWWTQNVFITFMPYGQITQVDSRDQTTFAESDCASGFRNTPTEAELVVCNTDDYGWSGFLGPGMARLNWYWPDDPDTTKMDSNGYGFLNMSHPAPGSNLTTTVLNTTGTSTYTFKPADVIESSLRGWILGGFGYDGVENAAQSALNAPSSGTTIQQALSLFSISPRSAGMFSVPVCVLTNLNYWPTYWSSTPQRTGGDNYCVCYGSPDKNGATFENYVPQALNYIVTHQLGIDGDEQCAPAQ